MSEKKSFIDKFMDFMDKLSGPLTSFTELKFVKALTTGMMQSMGITMVGSLFLVVWLFAADGNLTTKALLPFLTPFAPKLILVNSLSMGIIAIYMTIGMGSEYAKLKGFNSTTGAIGSVFAFFLIQYSSVASTVDGVGAFTINNWGGSGIIVAMVSVALAVNIIDFCYRKNIKISMPRMVPPAIADSFSAVIPYFIIALVSWTLRTIIGFDLANVISTILLPLLSAADNIWVYTVYITLTAAFWAVGIHGDNVAGAPFQALVQVWFNENNAAVVAGLPAPHVWVNNLNRLSQYICSVWPILIFMLTSKKLPHLKKLGIVALPSMIFCIIEPIMFGLPIIMNPFLMIPFILTTTVTGALTYFASSVGLIGRLYINLPWATPSPILGFLGTGGNVGAAIIVFINLGIGMLITYPFWKAYENAEVKKMELEQLKSKGV